MARNLTLQPTSQLVDRCWIRCAAFSALAMLLLAGCTLRPEPLIAAERFENGGVWARIESVSEEFGNLDTDLDSDALAKINLELHSKFRVTHRDTSVNAMFVTTYSDVPRGDWLGLQSDGKLRIARNLENAAATLGAKAGDRLFIEPVP